MNIIIVSVLVLLSITAVIWLTSKLRIQAFVALFVVSVLLAVTTLPASKIISTLKEGFGSTMASIGFLIIFGAMIGVILNKTGVTVTLASYILSKTGQKRSAAAMGIYSFITDLPIFCDSGFIVLSGLAKSFSRSAGVAMLSIGAGSMIFSHPNHSYFWVVSNFSGTETGINLKVFSSSTAIMGIAVFITVWITSFFML
ncbi:MAG TPA: hypothetical protein PK496_06895 [Bacteroidales bacterium]|nr:hypothetical protein [Bacteroidales bacterium]